MTTNKNIFLTLALLCAGVSIGMSAMDPQKQEELDEQLFQHIQGGATAEVIQADIGKGANPNAREKGANQTPLHFATFYGHTHLIQPLIDAKADVNAEDWRHNTPVFTALNSINIKDNQQKVKMVELLQKKGANISEENKERLETLRQSAKPAPSASTSAAAHIGTMAARPQPQPKMTSSQQLRGYLRQGDLDLQNLRTIKKLLQEQDCDVNEQESDGQTPLHLAMFKGDVTVIILLLGKKAKLDILDKFGASPLYKLIKYQPGCFSSVWPYIEKQVTLTSINPTLKSPLKAAEEKLKDFPHILKALKALQELLGELEQKKTSRQARQSSALTAQPRQRTAFAKQFSSVNPLTESTSATASSMQDLPLNAYADRLITLQQQQAKEFAAQEAQLRETRKAEEREAHVSRQLYDYLNPKIGKDSTDNSFWKTDPDKDPDKVGFWHDQKVGTLLAQKADIDVVMPGTRQQHVTTLLTEAVKNENLDILTTLVRAGARKMLNQQYVEFFDLDNRSDCIHQHVNTVLSYAPDLHENFELSLKKFLDTINGRKGLVGSRLRTNDREKLRCLFKWGYKANFQEEVLEIYKQFVQEHETLPLAAHPLAQETSWKEFNEVRKEYIKRLAEHLAQVIDVKALRNLVMEYSDYPIGSPGVPLDFTIAMNKALAQYNAKYWKQQREALWSNNAKTSASARIASASTSALEQTHAYPVHHTTMIASPALTTDSPLGRRLTSSASTDLTDNYDPLPLSRRRSSESNLYDTEDTVPSVAAAPSYTPAQIPGATGKKELPNPSPSISIQELAQTSKVQPTQLPQ